MKIAEYQELADYICECESIPRVPIRREPRMFRLYGKARWRRDMSDNGRIGLAQGCESWCDELAYSVLIHELCHVILRAKHTPAFFALCDQWHERFGIYEERRSKMYHGTMYRVAADGRKIAVDNDW